MYLSAICSVCNKLYTARSCTFFVSGIDSLSSYKRRMMTVVALLAHAGPTLTKWASRSATDWVAEADEGQTDLVSTSNPRVLMQSTARRRWPITDVNPRRPPTTPSAASRPLPPVDSAPAVIALNDDDDGWKPTHSVHGPIRYLQ